ncbi:hypothetical protein ACFY94_14890 [Streptomyces griseorubiginosus]|uniref:hypothetical protein n=1 Tax=Streptomyces griseorubiginosus TaxID=67304 RepID=UPI0036EE7704
MAGELDRERERIAQAGREALANIQRASAEASAAVVRVIEQQTGVSLGAPAAPSIMDATPKQIADAERRARHALAAVELIRRWHWGDARTLGELMPQLPEGVREQIADNFVKARIS